MLVRWSGRKFASTIAIKYSLLTEDGTLRGSARRPTRWVGGLALDRMVSWKWWIGRWLSSYKVPPTCKLSQLYQARFFSNAQAAHISPKLPWLYAWNEWRIWGWREQPAVQGRRFPPELGRVHSHSLFPSLSFPPRSLPVPYISPPFLLLLSASPRSVIPNPSPPHPPSKSSYGSALGSAVSSPHWAANAFACRLRK